MKMKKRVARAPAVAFLLLHHVLQSLVLGAGTPTPTLTGSRTATLPTASASGTNTLSQTMPLCPSTDDHGALPPEAEGGRETVAQHLFNFAAPGWAAAGGNRSYAYRSGKGVLLLGDGGAVRWGPPRGVPFGVLRLRVAKGARVQAELELASGAGRSVGNLTVTIHRGGGSVSCARDGGEPWAAEFGGIPPEGAPPAHSQSAGTDGLDGFDGFDGFDDVTVRVDRAATAPGVWLNGRPLPVCLNCTFEGAALVAAVALTGPAAVDSLLLCRTRRCAPRPPHLCRGAGGVCAPYACRNGWLGEQFECEGGDGRFSGAMLQACADGRRGAGCAAVAMSCGEANRLLGYKTKCGPDACDACLPGSDSASCTFRR
ncbi:hypothetical protein DIPPA_11556 [Diplonema papillatum]|nr:hypothetical protein DIPPA_15669 [Diplonema papillatum]KAJ9450779.1 hypothetical protein DIPPA_11556 [Diplonema papillatum]